MLAHPVMPAQAGIQMPHDSQDVDPRLRGSDGGRGGDGVHRGDDSRYGMPSRKKL